MQEKTKTTAQVLVDCLEAEGVDVMFGIPGEETLDLMFAIRDSHIRFIPVRHEQGAAFMADVRHVAAALHKAFSPDKINFGAYGDTMHHLHVHIVPKYKDDPFEFGDVFAMNPGRVTLEPAQYDEVAQAIIANL